MWAYVIFNIAAALLLYWLVRMPKKGKGGATEVHTPSDSPAGEEKKIHAARGTSASASESDVGNGKGDDRIGGENEKAKGD